MPSPAAESARAHPEALRRFGRNVRAGLTYQVTSTFLSFVTLPVVVTRLGAEAYGLWNMVSALCAFLGFTGLVFSSTAIRFMADARGRGQLRELREVYDVLWILALGGGVVMAGITILGASWIIGTLFHLSPAQHNLACWVLWCQLLVFPFQMVLAVDAGTIQAHQRLDVSNGIGIGYVVCHSVGIVIAVLLGGGLRAVVVWEACAIVASALAHFIVARRMLPQERVRLAIRPWCRRVWPFARKIVVGYVAGAWLLPMSRLLLGVFRPLAEVAYFTLAMKLASEVRTIATYAGGAAMPAASDLAGRADRRALALLFLKACRWSVLALIPVAALAATLGGRFISFWVSPEFGQACERLLLLIVPGLCVTFFSSVPGAIAQGVGRPGIWSAAQVVAVGLTALVGWCLIPAWGPLGAAIAVVIAGCSMTIPLTGWVVRQLSLDAAQLRFAFPPSVALLGVSMAGLSWLMRPLLPNLAMLLVCALSSSALYLWAMATWVCTAEERAILHRAWKPMESLKELVYTRGRR